MLPLLIAPASPAFALAAPPSTPDVTANLSTTPPSGWHRSRQPIRFVASDGGTGVRSITVVVDGTITERAGTDVTHYVDGNGTHAVEYWATDLAGNTGEAKSLSIAIDGTGPRIATAAPARIGRGDQIPLGLSCADEHSGVQSCFAEGTDDDILPSSELGEQSIALYALDYAGNETTSTFSYIVEEKPAQQPDIEFNIASEPASGWYRGPVGIIVSASTQDPSDRITGVHWWSRGPVSGSGSAVEESGIAFTVDTDGVTTVSYTATTAKGGFREGTATIRIDSTRPEISFTSPTPSAPGGVATVTLGRRAQATVECSDALSGVDFCGEELPLFAAESLPLDTSTLGRKSIVVESADVAGNRSKATLEYEVVAPGTGGVGDPGDGSGSGGVQTPGKPNPGAAGDGSAPVALAQTGVDGRWTSIGVLAGAAAAAGASLMLARVRRKHR